MPFPSSLKPQDAAFCSSRRTWRPSAAKRFPHKGLSWLGLFRQAGRTSDNRDYAMSVLLWNESFDALMAADVHGHSSSHDRVSM